MKSVFDIKESLMFDAVVFEQMKRSASCLLADTEDGKYTQVIVLLSEAGGEYAKVIVNALSENKSEEKELLERLSQAKDTVVTRVLCMWQDGGIDLPSMAFRKLLCELDPKNGESGIFVSTADGFSVIKTENTMK